MAIAVSVRCKFNHRKDTILYVWQILIQFICLATNIKIYRTVDINILQKCSTIFFKKNRLKIHILMERICNYKEFVQQYVECHRKSNTSPGILMTIEVAAFHW